ncbi:hypothetical protein QR685DRAFT_532533 [Neurospora intermedia]|uniref:2EXR domain-containing protein n=1 Tax=Neurospora intermedia TaxID=5142 RepID=A0ABR3D423_NEUIN
MMATTFHPFPRLPLELRLVIWEASISPRTINFNSRGFTTNDGDQEQQAEVSISKPESMIGTVFGTFASAPPPPTILHTCRESCNVGLHFQGGYQKAFCIWCLPYIFDGSWNQRYIWVHFGMDIIDLGDESPIVFIENEDREKIQRLKLDFDHEVYVWKKSEAQSFAEGMSKIFEQVREMSVCIPCEEASLKLPPDWLPGGSQGGFMEGWRTVDYTVSSGDGDEDGDGERNEDGKTDGKMWVMLVLEKENICAAESSS